MLIKVWLGEEENTSEERPKLTKANITCISPTGVIGLPVVLEVGNDKDEKAVQEAQFVMQPGSKLEVTELRPPIVYDPEEKTSVEGEWPDKKDVKAWEDYQKKAAEKKEKENKERIARMLHPRPPEESKELEKAGVAAVVVGAKAATPPPPVHHQTETVHPATPHQGQSPTRK